MRLLEKVFSKTAACVLLSLLSVLVDYPVISGLAEACAPPQHSCRGMADFDRLFRDVPTIRSNEVRDECQALRKSICRNRGGCTLPIFAT